MSTIQAGTTSTTALVTTGDTTGNIVLTADSGLVNASTSTGGLWLPSGTTAQRPASPQNGQMRYNTTTSLFEAYQGSSWINFVISSPPNVSYLVVAGGGGSGKSETSDPAGGGGAGGYRSSTLSVLANTPYTVTIGAGGLGGSFPNVQYQGGDTTFSSITSIGGGSGGNGSGTVGNSNTTRNGTSGGSGGGSGYAGVGGAGVGGSGTAGQGNSGATNTTSIGGGGGGSFAAGSGQSGGAGTSNSITGSAVTYAAGGAGASSSSGAGSAGAVNTGNGGVAPWNGNGQNGGSGIVVISYTTAYRLATATGTYSQTVVGANYIFTFTGSGTITF